MRLEILDRGQKLGAKLLFTVIHVVSRRAPPDVLKLLKYRPEFFGDGFSKLCHEMMRGPSPWSITERELMASVVSKANECEF
jgi:hypothetical protein